MAVPVFKTVLLHAEDAELSPWVVVDATDQVVGRLAAQIAWRLMGKHRPDYTPHVLCGDFVIVVNADKVHFTGRKWSNKTYSRYTGYSGGLKTVTATQLLDKRPQRVLEMAVKRMLPKTKLAYQMYRRLKAYPGAEHPHGAQQPTKLELAT